MHLPSSDSAASHQEDLLTRQLRRAQENEVCPVEGKRWNLEETGSRQGTGAGGGGLHSDAALKEWAQSSWNEDRVTRNRDALVQEPDLRSAT